MSLQLTGKAKICKPKIFDNKVECGLQIGKKKSNGEWENQYYNARFVGKSVDIAKSLIKGDVVNITSGILESFKFTAGANIGRTSTLIVIFEFDITQKKIEIQSTEEKVCEDCHLPISQCECLPF